MCVRARVCGRIGLVTGGGFHSLVGGKGTLEAAPNVTALPPGRLAFSFPSLLAQQVLLQVLRASMRRLSPEQWSWAKHCVVLAVVVSTDCFFGDRALRLESGSRIFMYAMAGRLAVSNLSASKVWLVFAIAAQLLAHRQYAYRGVGLEGNIAWFWTAVSLFGVQFVVFWSYRYRRWHVRNRLLRWVLWIPCFIARHALLIFVLHFYVLRALVIWKGLEAAPATAAELLGTLDPSSATG